MNTADRLHHRAAELAGAARAFHAGAEEPGSHAAAPDSLAALEEALQVLSAAWYQLAADASPGIVERQCGRASEAPAWPRFDGIPREQEVRLMGTLHDVAAAFARCAGACRDGRSTIARRVAGDERRPGDEFPRFQRPNDPRDAPHDRPLDPSARFAAAIDEARCIAARGGRAPMRALRMGRRRWLPGGRLARRSRGLVLGGVWLRCRTWRRRHELDRGLARGADPMQSDELSLRVGQLGSAGRRVQLAHALREAVAVANGHQASLITTRLRRREIRENQELLIALADRIRDGEPLGVQGLAITARLISDRSSPLYRSGVTGSLLATGLEALEALERGHRTARTTTASR